VSRTGKKTAAWAAILGVVFGCGPIACSGERAVLTGADVLLRDGWERATGLPPMPLGVVTNHTGRLRDGTHLVDALLDAGCEVRAIFSPEHGFEGSAAEGARIYSAGETYRGVPIHSLYGVTTRPDASQLDGLGALLFDIQDVGARFYTYVSTMARTMEAAAVRGLAYVVLDRPNPLGGTVVEGPVLDPALASFVGLFPLPIRHGFTVAEYASWIIGDTLLADAEDLELHLVLMDGWERRMSFEESGVPWIRPSPNMPEPATARVYPGTCLVEGTNLSEGRGTERPFELVGAPWAEAERTAGWLNDLQLPGVRFRPARFTPGLPGSAVEVKWKGEECRGIEIEVTDRETFRSVVTGVAVVSAFRHLYPDLFRWRAAHFDRLAGVSWLREGIDAGLSPGDLEERWREATAQWREEAMACWLYP